MAFLKPIEHPFFNPDVTMIWMYQYVACFSILKSCKSDGLALSGGL